MAPDYGDGIPEERSRPNPVWKIAMVSAPAFLLLSTAWALWIWWKKSQDDSVDPRLALVSVAAEVEELEDSLHKLSRVLGPRDWESVEGRINMRRAIALIDGTLSPRNYGFAVRTGEHLAHAGERWPTVWVDLAGVSDPMRILLVNAAYDRSDAAVALVLAVARDLRDEQFGPTIRFVFHPAQLYRGQAEEKLLTEILGKNELHSVTLVPEGPGGGTGSAPRGPWSGAQLKPLADAFAQRVRESASVR